MHMLVGASRIAMQHGNGVSHPKYLVAQDWWLSPRLGALVARGHIVGRTTLWRVEGRPRDIRVYECQGRSTGQALPLCPPLR